MNAFEVEALKIAECPVCYEIFCPPVFQCSNGHLICSRCLDNVNTCPTCRKPMPERPEERIRNLAVENLVSLKCPNLKWGCKVTLTRKDKGDHVLLCKYRSRDYCSRIEIGIECNKIVSKLDLSSHMKDEHKLTIIKSNEAAISQELEVGKLNRKRKWFSVVFSAFDDFFFLDCGITPLSSPARATISWKCISAGSVSTAQQFSATMTLIPVDKDVSLKWKGQVISIDELEEKDLNVFSLSTNSLREHTINKDLNKLSWKLHLVIQRKSSIPPFAKAVPPVINMILKVNIEGTYKPESGGRWWGNANAETVYSRNGSLWTRKVKNQFEYSFTFGQEATYKYGGHEFKSIITIENNKLIHREKQYLNGQLLAEITEIEEFSDNKMSTRDNYLGNTYTAVYKKIKG